MKRTLVLRRERLVELNRPELARVVAGTRSLECVDPETALASLQLDACVELSVLNCYSWHTEEC